MSRRLGVVEPQETKVLAVFQDPLSGRNLQLDCRASEPSQIDILLEEVQKAAESGCVGVVRDRLMKVSQFFQVLDAKQNRSRAVTRLSPGSGSSASLCGGVQYRPDFMLCSVLLADKLILVGKFRKHCDTVYCLSTYLNLTDQKFEFEHVNVNYKSCL